MGRKRAIGGPFALLGSTTYEEAKGLLKIEMEAKASCPICLRLTDLVSAMTTRPGTTESASADVASSLALKRAASYILKRRVIHSLDAIDDTSDRATGPPAMIDRAERCPPLLPLQLNTNFATTRPGHHSPELLRSSY